MSGHPAAALLLLASLVPAQESAPPGHQHTQDKPANPVDQRTLRITARIVDEAGAPIEGACLKAFTPDTPKDSYLCRQKPDAKSAADGTLTHTHTYPANQRPTWHLVARNRCSMNLRVTPQKRTIDGKEIYVADLGDVAMTKGASILGLIRSADGANIEGAQVTTKDILQHVLVNRQRAASHSTICYGISDAQGRVRLIGIPTFGMGVSVSADDHFSWRRAYHNRHTPLVATLEKGGSVDGVVVDETGKPVKDARVYVYSESSASSSGTTTKEDGLFKVKLSGKGRYRIRYYAKFEGEPSYRYEYSKIFKKPQKGLRLQFGAGATDGQGNPIAKAAKPRAKVQPTAAAKDKDRDKVTLRILDKNTNVALRKARATAVWWQPNMFEHNHGYLERQLERLKPQKLDERGNLKIAGPRGNQPPTGRILIAAKGYAPHLVKDVEFDHDAPKNELVIKMEKESAVSGVIVDPKDGTPIEGAKVIAVTDPSQLRHYNPQPVRRKIDSNQGAATTDKDGRFRLGELPSGSIQLYLAHKQRCDVPPIQIELKPGEELKDQKIEYPKGGSLLGQLTGTKIRPGWQVRVRRMPSQQNHFGTTWGLSGNEAFESAKVDTDGKFVFHGLSRANYFLSLMIRYPHGALEIEMEPIRMRTRDVTRTFDISEDLPGRLVGKVTIDGGTFPPGQLMLLARDMRKPVTSYYSGRPNLQGDFAFLDARGGFELPLSEGSYYLQVVDLQTNLTLYQGIRPIQVQATKDVTHDLSVAVAPVALELQPETAGNPIHITRVEIQATHPKPPQNRNFGVFMNNGNRDSGIGMRVDPGQTRIDLLLPLVPCKLLARSDAHNLDPKVNQYNFPPQGEVELTPEPGRTNKATLTITPPQIDLGDGDGDTKGAAEKDAKKAAKNALETLIRRR